MLRCLYFRSISPRHPLPPPHHVLSPSLQLRVAQRANAGQTTKLGKIKQVRKNIARVLTVVNQNARAAYHKQLKPKDMAPKALREKKTRAIRRRLTPAQVRMRYQCARRVHSASFFACSLTSPPPPIAGIQEDSQVTQEGGQLPPAQVFHQGLKCLLFLR